MMGRNFRHKGEELVDGVDTRKSLIGASSGGKIVANIGESDGNR